MLREVMHFERYLRQDTNKISSQSRIKAFQNYFSTTMRSLQQKLNSKIWKHTGKKLATLKNYFPQQNVPISKPKERYLSQPLPSEANNNV
jgi:hypothetical protein